MANYFLSLGYQKGDTVALLMENRPEYVSTWLGLAKIGVITALINHNQKLQALIHAIQIANSKAIIHGPEFSSGNNIKISSQLLWPKIPHEYLHDFLCVYHLVLLLFQMLRQFLIA